MVLIPNNSIFVVNYYMKTSASLDSLGQLITYSVLALMGVLSVVIATWFWEDPDGDRLIIFIFTEIICIGLPLFTYLYAPVAFSLQADALIIHRKMNSISIPLHQITSVKTMDYASMSGIIRLFGVGGMFGYYGIYRIQGIGIVNMYARHKKHFILLESAHKKWIITPDDASFAEAIKNQLTK